MFYITKITKLRSFHLTLSWVILVFAFVFANGLRHFHDNVFSIANDCGEPGCEVLPPPPSVEAEENFELFDLLARGSEFLDNYTDVTEAIVLLGNTGSGKTTLTQILAGNLSKLHSVLTSGCSAVIIDEDNKIGLPSTKSKTLFPELVFKTDANSTTVPLAFYDFPGFDDTRGDVQDIGANFFMNQVIGKISTAKFLFLVTHSSVNFNDRVDFDLLATHAATFIKNLHKYTESIALVVTKVASYSGMGRYIEDSTIISGIVEFLTKYQDELKSKLSNNTNQDPLLPNKILFVETLLYRNPSSGYYSKIWFVRSPLECGPLNEQEMIHHIKSNITKMYEDLNYTGITSTADFGFTLKAETKLVMANYTRSINTGILSAVELIVEDFQRHYFKSGNLVDFDNLNFTILNRTMHINSLPLKSIVNELQSNISTSTELSNILKFSLKALRYHVPSKFQSFMTWQEEYLTFFDEAIGEKQERSVDKWSEPILKLNEAFLDLVDWYEFCLVLETHVSSYLFQYKKHELPSKSPTDSFLNFIDTHQIVPVSRQIKEVASRIEHQHSNLLDVIMAFALEKHTEHCDPTNNAIIFQGNFLQLSKLPSPSSFLTKCGDKTTQVHLYAARTIFLDVNLNLENFDLVMIAPIWTNPKETTTNIALTGKAASHVYPKAANGNTDQPGTAGCMGVTGFPGGTIFGISSSTTQSSYPVTIISQGGKGGKGQEGGNGGPGSPGRNANHGSDGSDYTSFRNSNCWFVKPNVKGHYGFRGNDGKTGGDGGMPGIGGLSVDSKNVFLVTFQNPNLAQFTSKPGENGIAGTGGNGGNGGSAGNGYKCNKRCAGGWSCSSRGPDCSRGRCPGNPGSRGVNGRSSRCPNEPIKPRELFKWPALVKYRASFFNETDLTTTTFLGEIDKRAETKSLFTLKALAEESLALEGVNRSEANPKRLREMYMSLISRLEDFSKINYNSLSNEHKKIVKILLSLASSSLINFDRAQNYDVIVDVSHYFSVIERQINLLRTSTSLQAIREVKEKFTQNLKGKMNQALGFLKDTVTPALEQAKEDLEVKVDLLEDQLVSMIEDTKLSLEEMKEKLRKANEQQGFLKFLKIFDVIGNIFPVSIPITGFPTLENLVKKLQGRFSGKPEELERLKQLVDETEKLLEELEEKRKEFEKLQPLVDSLMEYFKNVSDSLVSGQEIERPQLLLTKWQVMTKLKEVKNSLDVFGDESINLRPLTYAIDRIQDAMTISIDMYDMIEEYLEAVSLADHISTVNSAILDPIQITDPEYAHTVGNFDIKIRQNLLDVEVKKAMHAFKQWVFPFAKFYFGGQSRFVRQGNTSSELGADHLHKIENLQLELEKYKAMSVGNQDTFIILTNFSSGLKSGKPFFTWTNNLWREKIHSLISGNEVNFQADVRLQGMAGWEAIKFKLIEVNLKLNHATQEMQEEFDDILEYFGISMTHSGVSNYRFQQDYFVMTGANQTLRYNFERDSNGNRLGTNLVYEKFKNGDFLLSPYTLWTIQLGNVAPLRKGKMLGKDVGFESLEKFLPYIDLELVGMGTYTDGETALSAANGDMQLDMYYERDERVRIDFKY